MRACNNDYKGKSVKNDSKENIDKNFKKMWNLNYTFIEKYLLLPNLWYNILHKYIIKRLIKN